MIRDAEEGLAVPGLGDEQGLGAAYAAYGAELYRFVPRGLGDAGAAQDVVQETFLRAWRAADRFDPALASLRVWLFAIARKRDGRPRPCGAGPPVAGDAARLLRWSSARPL